MIFLLHLVTVHETWVHYYEPENKAQSRQWVGPGSPWPKKIKPQRSAGIYLMFAPDNNRIRSTEIFSTFIGVEWSLIYLDRFHH